MIDLMITATLGILLAGVTLPTIAESVRQAKADAAMNVALTHLRMARQFAVDQRRIFKVTFTSPSSIQITRKETNGAWTAIGTNYLPHPFQFHLASEAPTGSSQMPDGIPANGAVDFGGSQTVFLQPDGTATDANKDTVQGVVFLGIPGKPLSARAVTLFGGTARAKGWRLSEQAEQWQWSN